MTAIYALDAAFRVRDFVESRAAHRKRYQDGHGHKYMTPDSITAEYGELHMADLWTLCEAVENGSPLTNDG